MKRKIGKSDKRLRSGRFFRVFVASLTAASLILAPVSAEEAASEESFVEEPVAAEPVSEENAEAVTGDASSSPEKEESVYVIADAAGTVNKIIVSDWLKNPGHEAILEDQTSLAGIENLKGDETWTDHGDGKISWNAGGKDIYYQGTADGELPVEVSVRFFLDGEEQSPEDIRGKSGRVTVRYEYENNEEQEVRLENEAVRLHVPFAVVTGLLLDTGSLTDIEVVNGRTVTDGEHTFAVGIAFPGIDEDLGSPAFAALTRLGEAEVPDYMEISGETESFRWGTTYMLVTNGIFSSDEPDLTDSVGQLFGKTGMLHSGVEQIGEGADSVNKGAGELKTGADALSKELQELAKSNDSLKEGAGEIFDSMLENTKEQLKACGIQAPDLTGDNYSEVLGALQEGADEEEKEKIAKMAVQLDSVKDFCGGLDTYIAGVSSAKTGADELKKGAGDLKTGTSKLVLGLGILEAAVPDFSDVTEALKESAALGQEYDHYSGLAEGVKGRVRFIWKVEGI